MAPRKKRTPTSKRPAGIDRNALRKLQDEREQIGHDRLQRLLQTIVDRMGGTKPEFGVVDGLMELSEARMVALAADPPQANAAVNATIAKCKLMGLYIDRSQVAHGSMPAAQEGEEAIIERLRERAGSRAADEFMKFIANMRRAYDGGPTIDGDAAEIE